ncbi:MAG: hypothetical protein WA865_08730 [Spirulinaceae cyanobacterium]
MLVDKEAFTPEYITQDRWLRGIEPVAQEAVAKLNQGMIPAISEFMESC